MEIATSFGAMVNLIAPLTELLVAVIVTVPLDWAVNSPPAATCAMLLLEELQVTEAVKSFVVLSV